MSLPDGTRRLVELAGCGHALLEEDPDRTLAEIAAFLAGLEPGAR